ncbi:MAG: RNA methyltransferase, partial [Firmicutes bacterium]|nr:RNA methyltransferase [Bacillota bacterium]
MRQINSSDNRIVREAVSLLEKKYRDRLGLYLIEGPNIIGEAVSRKGTVKTVFLRSDAQDADALGTAQAAEEAGIDVCVLSRELFSRITDARTPQCIAAEAYKPDEPDLSALPEGANVLVLDRLQDPGNVGTLIRTAEAMGFSAAVLV